MSIAGHSYFVVRNPQHQKAQWQKVQTKDFKVMKNGRKANGRKVLKSFVVWLRIVNEEE